MGRLYSKNQGQHIQKSYMPDIWTIWMVHTWLHQVWSFNEQLGKKNKEHKFKLAIRFINKSIIFSFF